VLLAVADLLVLAVALKTQAVNIADCFTVKIKQKKTVRDGNISIFCSDYYRSNANLRARSLARAVDLPAKSFDLARPGVAPPLFMDLYIMETCVFRTN